MKNCSFKYYQISKWLELYFADSMNLKLNINYYLKKIELSLNGTEKKILIKLLPDLYKLEKVENVFWWNSSNENFEFTINKSLPMIGIKKLPGVFFSENNNHYYINYDVFGMIFRKLNLLEEFNNDNLDQHKRFMSINSHAYRNNYLHRPIIDEWVNILKQVFLRVWPSIKFKINYFNLNLTHDVDEPFQYYFKNNISFIKEMSGDLLKRRNLNIFSNTFKHWINKIRKNSIDPYDNFDWLMDQSEKNNIVSTFYFFTGHSKNKYDPKYDIKDNRIRELLKKIYCRGHKIGLHPSYDAYNSLQKLNEEFQTLKEICELENIQQNHFGSRMHYLRWNHYNSLRYLDKVGLVYDNTLTYAENSGFRLGTCFKFRGFDYRNMKTLKIIVRPLIAMEMTFISNLYLNLDKDEIYNQINKLKIQCKKLNGEFSLLWHNNEVVSKELIEIFLKLISKNKI